MKKNWQLIGIVLILFFGQYTIFSQVTITSLTVIPNNPTSIDNIKTIASSFYTSAGCNFITSSVAIIADTIKVISKHAVGPLTTLCNSTDTIALGQLSPGNYILIFYLKEFRTSKTYDIDTTNFYVTFPTSLHTLKKQTPLGVIYPNPTNSSFSIDIFNNKDSVSS